MFFPIQRKVKYAILFRLIFFFIRGVTSQLTINLEEYNPTRPNPVFVGEDVIFTGSAQSSSPPFGIACKVNIKGSVIEICDLNVGNCNGPDTDTCNCVSQVGDTYNFVITDPAREERSEALLYCEVSGIESQRRTYPVIQKPPTTVTSTTITTTPGTSTGPTDVTNDNVTFTTVTTGVGGDSVSPTVTVSTTPQIDTTDGPTTETTTGAGDHTDHTGEIVGGVCGGLAGIALGICIYCICKKKKVCCWKGAPVTSDQPSDSPAEEASTVHSTNHNALTSSKPEDKVEMTGEKKKKKSKKSTNAGSPKKKKKDFENGEKKMDENEPRCLPQPEPVAEPGLSTSLSNPEALKSNFATTRLSSPPSNTRPTSIEMTSAPRPLPSPRNPNM